MDNHPSLTPCRIVVLENIRSAHNVGAIFRTAEAAGVTHIYVVGCTPSPIDRFGRAVPEIVKTALGAEQIVPYTYHHDTQSVLDVLTAQEVMSVAVEQTPDASSIYRYTPPSRVAYIFGNEVDGVQPDTLAATQATISIPMYGRKESLNVSVSVGVTLYVTDPKSVDY